MNDERLAAYLSGDLDPDEQARIAAMLAGDAGLRARADRIAAADRALADLADVDLPEGFSQRLRAAVQPALDEVLGDELAARRVRRAQRARWVTAGAAAAAVAIVGIGTVLTDLGRGGDDIAATSGEPESAEIALDGGLAVPEVVALGRDLSEADLQSLAASQKFTAALSGQLSADDAETFAERSQGTMDATADQGGQQAVPPAAFEDGTTGGVGADDEAADGDGDTVTARDAAAACLPTVVGSSEQALVPLYAELATFRGEDVIVFVVLGPRGGSEELTRVEVWVLTVDGCETRYFTQFDQ